MFIIIVHIKTCFENVWGSKLVITGVITGKKRGLNESRAIIFFQCHASLREKAFVDCIARLVTVDFKYLTRENIIP